MSTGEVVTNERRELRSHLQDIADEQNDLGTIPTALAAAIHSAELDTDKKRIGLGFIRAWSRYHRVNNVPEENPFAIRYHITQFAAQELGERLSHETLDEVSLSQVEKDGISFADILSDYVSTDILSDPDVAIVGGTARLALKMLAGVDIKAELPISDIDAVITSDTNDIAEKANEYGIDLSGAKIIDGDVRSALDGLATNFDCTINQAAIYDGKLLYSKRALEDIKEGNIRLIAKNDPLFGSEGVVLPDGNVYINRVGFYRGLSLLLRGKGKQLIVSEENIEREKDSIGRYWQILLFVKLLPMKDESARYEAIGHWHELASRLKVTLTTSPEDFLNELMEAFPETHAGSKRAFNAEGQARWIIGRLIGEAVSHLYDQEEFIPPGTYTEARLTLSNAFNAYDYDSFLNSARMTRNS